MMKGADGKTEPPLLLSRNDMQGSQRSTRTKRGVSLIEVLFAVFMVAVCAVILVAAMPTASRSQAMSDLNNKATNLGQKELEAVRGLGYANVTFEQLFAAGLIDSTTTVAANTWSFTNVDTGLNDSASKLLPSGTGRVKIEQMGLDLRRVTVTVNWTARGVPKSISLGTLIANL